MKLFTKSRFKTCLDCPTKLYYLERETEYENGKAEDKFLEALAEGGYQVGTLAKLYHPEGVDIIERGYDIPIQKTNELLKKEHVVIFEAAIRFNNFFVRVDILEKIGNKIHLIEVKSKSYDGDVSNFQVKSKASNPYVQDVAFQTFVAQQAFPKWHIKPFLMYADKSKRATINGLNQMFRLHKDKEGFLSVIINDELVKEKGLGIPVLTKIDVSDLVENILNPDDDSNNFADKVNEWAAKYCKGEKIFAPLKVACLKCEFQSNDLSKSGFKECWSKFHNWSDTDYFKPSISEIWDNRRKPKMFEKEIFFMEQVKKDDLGKFPSPSTELRRVERQWLQIEKQKNKDTSSFIETDGLKKEMQSFAYPLHFIDFETCMVAIPFYKGQRPYEQIAFQFSHHIMYDDGRVEHKSEFIETEKGKFPNFNFVRALKSQLDKDNGTIFRYAAHENTVLNQLRVQIENMSYAELADKDDLINFIDSITNKAPRSMVDMLKLVKKYYYHPLMKGSNSIKFVLPAVMNTDFIKNKYAKPISQINISSLNFPEDMVWVKIEEETGLVKNPYKLLDPVFKDIDQELVENFISDENIADGGAAMTAFAKMQFTEMTEEERAYVISGLKRYCELDTLAMVIIYDYWLSEII